MGGHVALLTYCTSNFSEEVRMQRIKVLVVDDHAEMRRTIREFFDTTANDLVGEKIKTLVSGYYAGGRYTATWDGTDDHGEKVASGTYFYRLISGNFVSGKKMILLK